MTSQGSAYSRFRRSLDNRSLTNALAAAAELRPLPLSDSLELLLLVAEKDAERFPRLALRWHGRLCREHNLSLEEAIAVLAALVLLGGERKQNAAYALAELLSRRGMERPCKALVAWARAKGAELKDQG